MDEIGSEPAAMLPTDTHVPHPKEKGLNALLRKTFRCLGRLQGRHPVIFLVLSAVVASLSVGVIQIRLEDRIRDGYTPVNAPSQIETKIYKEFYGTDGDPQMSVVLVQSADGESLLEDRHLNAAVDLVDLLMNRLVVNVTENTYFISPADNLTNSDTHLLVYKDVCQPYCIINEVFRLFRDALRKQRALLRNGNPPDTAIRLDFPLALIDGIKWNLARNFFDVKTKKTDTTLGNETLVDPVVGILGSEGDTEDDDDEISNDNLDNSTETTAGVTTTKSIAAVTTDEDKLLMEATSLRSIGTFMLIFRADRSSKRRAETLPLWEVAAFDYVQNDYRNPYISAMVVGMEILNKEMIRDGQKTTPFFSMGFLLMSVFVGVSMLLSAVYYGEADAGKLIVAFGAILSPIAAITTTFGLISFLGFRTNSIMLVTPFLVMAIGVDDAFLMIHSWERLAHRGDDVRPKTISDRLGTVLEEVGPSVLITSLTNSLAFGIGAFTPTPEIRLFCMTTAIATALDFFFEIALFASLLALAGHCERWGKRAASGGHREKVQPLKIIPIQSVARSLQRAYARLLAHKTTVMLVTLALFGYWGLAIHGVSTMRSRLDTQKILPKDSPLLKADSLMSNVVWKEYQPVTVMVNSPLDYANGTQMRRFNKMVNEFETAPNMIGPTSTQLWLNDYKQYYELSNNVFEVFGLDGVEEYEVYDDEDDYYGNQSDYVNDDDRKNDEPKKEKDADAVNLNLLQEFLQMVPFRHWKGMLRYKKDDATPVVTRFVWVTASQNNTTWEKRISLMREWRRIAANYSDLNVTVWEANGHFVDQMLSLKSVTVGTVVVTFVTMAAVCALLIPSFVSVVCAAVAIGSISLGVLGALSLSGIDLDPVVMAATLMSIGLSVDFTAHTSYHFQQTSNVATNAERVEATLESVGWPMIQAGLSTVFCVLPLIFLRSYAPDVFLKTIILVVVLGLVHGLVVLPAILAALPRRCVCQHPNTMEWPTAEERRRSLYTVTQQHELQRLNA